MRMLMMRLLTQVMTIRAVGTMVVLVLRSLSRLLLLLSLFLFLGLSCISLIVITLIVVFSLVGFTRFPACRCCGRCHGRLRVLRLAPLRHTNLSSDITLLRMLLLLLPLLLRRLRTLRRLLWLPILSGGGGTSS